ncbi:MAG: LCP family protein [Cellulosilyticum sp.]|nr:LCP family protein [Cellulosilyticum sp.]
MSQQKKLKKKQKKTLAQIFVRTVAITFAVLVVAVGGFAYVYQQNFYNGDTGPIFAKKEKDPINKTLAVFGVDEDGVRTDVIFVLNYNSETDKMRIISVPRDTRVEWTDSQQELVQELKGYNISISKLNEMTSYGSMDKIRELTIAYLEDTLDLQIDNYVIVTLDAFKKIVDAIGGVEVDVPALDGNGLHYDDNYQDLHIHLDPGVQTLNGEEAEGLVRYRKGYAEGDVGRIKTQQLFLDAFAKKVTSPSIITKIPNIINAVSESVTTDIKLSEIKDYLPYLSSMTAENLTFNIVPGEGQYIGGKSYYVIDEEALPLFLEEVFNENVEEEPKEVVIDKTVSIEVLNSTSTKGVAGKAREELETEGYSVNEIGNYTLDTLNRTIVYVKDETLGQQFLNYYPGALIKVDTNITYDICIVLGNDAIE